MRRLRTALAATAALLSACFCTPAAASDWKRNCTLFGDDVELRTDLDDDEKSQWRASPHIWIGFLWENDSYAAGGDRHYTNGMKLSWLHNPCRGKHQWLEHTFRAFHPQDGKKEQRYYTGGVFGMNMYTPTDLRNPVRQRFDRPYVGWLYGGWQVQLLEGKRHPSIAEREADREGVTLTTFELQVGVVGPAAAQGPIQEWIHRDLGISDAFPHWEHQVPDHIGVVAMYQKARNYWLMPGKRLRGTLFGGGSLGNVVTFANAGALVAFGNPGESMIASSTIQPSGTGPIALQLMRNDAALMAREAADAGAAEKSRPSRAAPDGREWALFAGTDHRYILRSVFIEGKGEAAHDISLVHHVYDIFVGFSVQFGKDHSLTYKHLRRSVEFLSAEPSVMKRHDIGQIAYEMRF